MNLSDCQFDFVIESVTEEQAYDLLDLIIDYAEKIGTKVGGGFKPLEYGTE